MAIQWLSVASSPSLLACREAISLVCEALPGTKGALRKRKVEWKQREGGMDEWIESERNSVLTERAEEMDDEKRKG